MYHFIAIVHHLNVIIGDRIDIKNDNIRKNTIVMGPSFVAQNHVIDN